MSGYTEKLGDLQTKILKHMLSCDLEGVETVSHISKEVDALQPDVFRSTKLMIQEGILEKKTTQKSNRKELVLTDKGMAVALLNGIKHRKLAEYLEPTEYRDEYDRQRHKIVDIIMGLEQVPARRSLILNRALEYMVRHGWYEQEKKVLDQKDRIYLFTHLIRYILMSPAEVGEIVKLIDRFGINRDFFWYSLLEKLGPIIEIINEYARDTKRLSEPLIPLTILDKLDEVRYWSYRERMQKLTNELVKLEELLNHDTVRIQMSIGGDQERMKVVQQSTLEERIAAVSEIADSSALYNSIKIKLPKTLPNSTIKLDVRKLHKKILERRARTGETKLNTEAIKMIISELRSAQPMAAEEPSPKKSKRHQG
ncbi:MAG: hypothetical protein ACRD8W_02005 [Nitrososphaeraceae archaeon]